VSNQSTSSTTNQVQNNKALLMQSMGIKAEQIKVTPTKARTTKAPSTEAELIKAKVKEAIEKTLRDNGAKYYKFSYFATNGKDKDNNQLFKDMEITKLCIPIKEIGKDGKPTGLFNMFYVDHWNKSIKSADYMETGQ
tara:strand:+ start:88 stop:498 length:411 start_codon:yes stop_codon:yes gene_type:complete